jgi:heme-degrading monooxygenase HmoA
MFVRIVNMNLKAGAGPGFARVIDEEVIPMLRKFTGFRDEIAMVSADGTQAVGISFWQQRDHAEAYNRTGYPDVLSALSRYTEGTPTIKEYEVTNSTAHAISTRKAGG